MKKRVVHSISDDGYTAKCGVNHPPFRSDNTKHVSCAKCLQVLFPKLSAEDARRVNDQPTNEELMAKLKLIEDSMREMMYTLLNVLNHLKK